MTTKINDIEKTTSSLDSSLYVQESHVQENKEAIRAYKIKVDGEFFTVINNITIDESIFDEEKVDYILENRQSLLNYFNELVTEVQGSEKQLVIADIEYLKKLNDEYLLTHITTDEWISPLEDTKKFNDACTEILDCNLSVKT